MGLQIKAIEFSEKSKVMAITPFKVIQYHIGTNLKPLCDFLLVINSN